MADNIGDVPTGPSSPVPSGGSNPEGIGMKRGDKHHWGVIGISRDQWTLIATALTLGGSIRAGVEDNLYLPDGTMARSNGDLIAQARKMTEDVGRRPATVAEARGLLGIA